jgi:Domain of unknown function (DUF4160)
MPVVFHERGFRFFFFSYEGNPREPAHIHVKGGGGEAKFWIGEPVEMAYNRRMSSRDLAMVALIIRARRKELLDAWHRHFA